MPSVLGIAEIDSLLPLHDSLSAFGFELLALSLDKVEDDTLLARYVWSRGWNNIALFDSARTAATAYGVTMMPTTVLVGMDTTIVYTQRGFQRGDAEAIRLQVAQWLPGGHSRENQAGRLAIPTAVLTSSPASPGIQP